MLGGVSDPTSLGKGLALLLLPMFYALILSEIIYALLCKTYSGDVEPQSKAPLTGKGIAILCAVFSLVMIVSLVAIVSFMDFA